MSRIATFGASQMYLSRINTIQQRLSEQQIQLTTEKKSTAYTGISRDAPRLINFENERARAAEYVDNNAQATTRLKAASVSMNAIERTMKDFRDRLEDFKTMTTTDENTVKSVQEWAFRSMLDLQSYLSANVGGQYIFSGGRVSTEPVKLPAADLKSFQTIYDGNDHTYPTTRSAHMLDTKLTPTQTGDLDFDAAAGTITAATAGSLNSVPVGSKITVSGANAANNNTYTVVANTGTQIKVSRLSTETTAGATISFGSTSLNSGTTGNLTFAPGTDTITAATAGSLAGLTVGTVFTISGSGSNNGTYEVAATNGSDQITIRSTKIGLTENNAAATITAESWYRGDTLTVQHRVDDDRIIDLGIYASDPAFEKAFRAMGMIAQGKFGTAGSLENNLQRVEQALYLINDALDAPAGPAAPFGTELTRDLQAMQADVGFTMSLIKTKDDKHKQYMGFLDTRIADMENIDKNEVVARLLDDQRALDISYNALARVREMSLINYMK